MENEVILGNVMVDCDDEKKLQKFYIKKQEVSFQNLINYLIIFGLNQVLGTEFFLICCREKKE